MEHYIYRLSSYIKDTFNSVSKLDYQKLSVELSFSASLKEGKLVAMLASGGISGAIKVMVEFSKNSDIN